jgi:hypothetical protein
MRRSRASRVFETVFLGYLLVALVTRMQEAAGARTCGCDPDRWCKKPGLSLFRWVFPRGHAIRPPVGLA